MTTHLNIFDSEPRTCIKCEEIKDSSEFYRRKTGRLRRECKRCQLAKNIIYQKSPAGRASVNKSHKKYRARGRHTKNNRQWRERNPAKWKAHGILAYRIKIGEVTRPNHCETCGAECVPHGHHDDYSKPLDVEWLCVPCHKLEHTHD